MSLFKVVQFNEIYNIDNPPASFYDRYGVAIKQLMIDVNTNELYILQPKNHVIPLSSKYSTIAQYQKLKEEVDIVSTKLDGCFRYIENRPDITDPSALPLIYPTAEKGWVVTIAGNKNYVYTGNNEWVEFGVGYSPSGSYIPSGCKFQQLTSYIVISEWNKLVSICTPGVENALNTIINNYNSKYCKSFSSFFDYSISAGINAVSALDLAMLALSRATSAYNTVSKVETIAVSAYNKAVSAENKINDIQNIAISAYNTSVSAHSMSLQALLSALAAYNTSVSAQRIAVSAYNFASSNYEIIKTLTGNITGTISGLVSGTVGDIVNNYLTVSSVTKTDFNMLSSSYNNFVDKVLADQANMEQSLSSLQTGLDKINTNLSAIYKDL